MTKHHEGELREGECPKERKAREWAAAVGLTELELDGDYDDHDENDARDEDFLDFDSDDDSESSESEDWEDEPRAECPASGIELEGRDVGSTPKTLRLPRAQVMPSMYTRVEGHCKPRSWWGSKRFNKQWASNHDLDVFARFAGLRHN